MLEKKLHRIATHPLQFHPSLNHGPWGICLAYQNWYKKQHRERQAHPDAATKQWSDPLQCLVLSLGYAWKLWQQEGWEEAIDEALCADTIFDAGIKVEKSGIDWGRLQILREETHGAASGSHDKVSDIPRACVQYTCLRIEVLTSYNIHLLQAGVQF